MILLVDIGNTRIKWARLERGALGQQSAAAHAGWSAEKLMEMMLRTGARAQRALVSNVGGARMGELAHEALVREWGIEPQFVVASASAGGVVNGYADPAKLGVDRWLAVIAARALERGAVCVVSVGTAMTIDGLDATGRHLGGAIVPGPDLMLASLLQSTSEIASRAEQGRAGKALFANDTLGAIRQGAEHALAALVERAVETMQRELGEAPTLLLTGGASSRLDGALHLPYRAVPDLVLRGLAVLAAQPQT